MKSPSTSSLKGNCTQTSAHTETHFSCQMESLEDTSQHFFLHFFWCPYTDFKYKIKSWQKIMSTEKGKIIMFLFKRQKPLYINVLSVETCPFVAWLARGVKQGLQALRQHFMLVCHWRYFWHRLCDKTGTQLEFEPLHLVVVQVFLN